MSSIWFYPIKCKSGYVWSLIVTLFYSLVSSLVNFHMKDLYYLRIPQNYKRNVFIEYKLIFQFTIF